MKKWKASLILVILMLSALAPAVVFATYRICIWRIHNFIPLRICLYIPS